MGALIIRRDTCLSPMCRCGGTFLVLPFESVPAAALGLYLTRSRQFVLIVGHSFPEETILSRQAVILYFTIAHRLRKL